MFQVLAYNIFARSLGSNCIPWVLSIDERWQAQVSQLLNCSHDTWIANSLSTEYRRHFHKNYFSGNKVEMRKLWSRHITGPDDIPSTLTGLSFVTENCVKYTALNTTTGVATEEVATTLRGILSRDIPSLAGELYDHIMEKDSFFRWERRGPKIFREVTGFNAEVESVADIVTLAEYDIHNGPAMYGDAGVLETFPEAMRRVGYSGCLLNGPLHTDMSGIGVFWKEDVFTLADASDECAAEVRNGNDGGSVLFSLQTGESHRGAYNYDLQERWHRVHAGDLAVMADELMTTKDRRNVGFLRLRHRRSGRVVLFVSVHLMTESRDCSSTNAFPGEVRAGELEAIAKLMRLHLTGEVHSVILGGDFNIDVRARDILKGRVKSVVDGSELTLASGFDDSMDYMNPSLRYVREIFSGLENVVELKEAFSSIHKWGADVGRQQRCTAYTPHRAAWIDMMWYTPHSLRVHRLSNMSTPTTFIPNEDHGSDHLPLRAVFEIID